MLLDTSGLLCLLDPAERHHELARRLFDAARARFTHNYVIAELVALADARRLPRATALHFVDGLHQQVSVSIIHVTEIMHHEAFGVLLSRRDKRWSLCDAVSFLLMEADNVTDALTTDHHFEQAGFVRLLK